MRKAFRHTGVLMMLAVVALGLLGAAYALWYEDLSLNATVNTGTLNANWTLHSVTGDPAGPSVQAVRSTNTGTSWGPFVLPNEAGKQTTCSAAISTNAAGDQTGTGGDNNVLTLVAENLYPFAGCEFGIDIDSTGTVPIHIAAQRLNNLPAGIVLEAVGGDTAVCNQILGAGAALADLNPNVQLHTGQSVNCTLRISALQSAAEGIPTQTIALLTLRAHQWNETVP